MLLRVLRWILLREQRWILLRVQRWILLRVLPIDLHFQYLAGWCSRQALRWDWVYHQEALAPDLPGYHHRCRPGTEQLRYFGQQV